VIFGELKSLSNSSQIKTLLEDIDKIRQQLNEREEELNTKKVPSLLKKGKRLDELQAILDQKRQ
jgi:hypothetical protein